MRQIASAAQRFGAGDLMARARLARHDELGALGEAFDAMANRVAALVRAEKELLAHISHELRTPLARIRVALDIAAERPERMADGLLVSVGQDLREVDDLIAGILAEARVAAAEAGLGSSLSVRAQTIAPAELVRQAVARFARMHPRHALRVQMGDALPALHVDRRLVRRALDNLLDNLLDNAAWHAGPDADAVALQVEATCDVVRMLVRDQGPGFSAQALRHGLEPFFRDPTTTEVAGAMAASAPIALGTDPPRGADRGPEAAHGPAPRPPRVGLGLGLAFVRRVAQSHGGQVVLMNEPAGACVALTLPARASPGACT